MDLCQCEFYAVPHVKQSHHVTGLLQCVIFDVCHSEQCLVEAEWMPSVHSTGVGEMLFHVLSRPKGSLVRFSTRAQFSDLCVGFLQHTVLCP